MAERDKSNHNNNYIKCNGLKMNGKKNNRKEYREDVRQSQKV